MRDIRADNLSNLRPLGHLDSILTRSNNKLETPESIIRTAKPAADSRPLRIAEKPKVLGEEQIVHHLRGISQIPQWERGMCLWCWQVYFPVERHPGFIVFSS